MEVEEHLIVRGTHERDAPIETPAVGGRERRRLNGTRRWEKPKLRAFFDELSPADIPARGVAGKSLAAEAILCVSEEQEEEVGERIY